MSLDVVMGLILTAELGMRCVAAQDSDSWSEAAAWNVCEELRQISSDHRLVQGYHWWQEPDLQLWPWDKATDLQMEKSKLTET
jgi:hypothetical protein